MQDISETALDVNKYAHHGSQNVDIIFLGAAT